MLSNCNPDLLVGLEDLHLEMGVQCNVRCSMCYQVDFSPSSQLPDVIWRDRLHPAYAAAKRLTIQGGEPTIMKNCHELLTLVRADYPHLKLLTVTNGQVLSALWENAFLEQGDHLNFSLNSIRKPVYQKLVQFGQHKKIMDNIDRMVRRKRETGSEVILRISMVILEETWDELPDFIQWGADHGLDEVIFLTDPTLIPRAAPPSAVRQKIQEAYGAVDRHPQIRVIHLTDFDSYYAGIHRLATVRSVRTEASNSCECPLAFSMLFVDHLGWARACCKSWYPFGNLTSTSVQEIWNGTRATRFRNRVRWRDYRDCLPSCDLNPNPASNFTAGTRRAYWAWRREPQNTVKKAFRKLGITTAQREEKPKG